MRVYELNRWKELYCVVNGHDFSETRTEKELNGRILVITKTCGCCGLSCIDESGILNRAKEKYQIK